jgi:hypothetical protein
MAGSDVVYVTLAPTGMSSKAVIESVAKILNKDVFAARALLNSKIPKVAGYYPDIQTAEPVAQGLKSLGFTVIVCHDSELRRSSPARFRAHTLQLGKRDVAFRDKGGQTRTFEEGSLFLILRGTTRTHAEKRAGMTGPGVNESATLGQREPGGSKSEMSINLPATLMTGIPIMKKTKEKAKVQSVQYGEFVRLYDRTLLDPIVEILQSDFDYSSLGDKKALSSSQNLSILITELKTRFPQAILDSRLTERFRADMPFATPEDEIEINSRLIYLHHRAGSGHSTSV